MKIVEWKDKFSVHVDEMDRHHKKLLGYLAELQKEIASNDAAKKVGETLNALIEYAGFHFVEEERLMRAMSYPELAVQIDQHAYFANEVNEMLKQFHQGILPSRSVLAFLSDWFINHIMQEDYKYGKMIELGKPIFKELQ
jgi:hemerythrin-like metal-binding domain